MRRRPAQADVEPAEVAPPAGGRRRTPQERKALDYKKQRRNVYGENPKASLKGISNGKARGRCLERRGVAQELKLGEDADVAPVAARLAKRRFRKWPDAPLGEVVKAKIAWRARLRDEPRATDESRARRRGRRARTGR